MYCSSHEIYLVLVLRKSQTNYSASTQKHTLYSIYGSISVLVRSQFLSLFCIPYFISDDRKNKSWLMSVNNKVFSYVLLHKWFTKPVFNCESHYCDIKQNNKNNSLYGSLQLLLFCVCRIEQKFTFFPHLTFTDTLFGTQKKNIFYFRTDTNK